MALASTPLSVYRIDAGRYAQIIRSGALEGAYVELVDGIITDMSPQSPQHAALIQRLTAHLRGATGLRVQLALHVSSDSVLEPDVAVTGHAPDPHSHPATARLVIEVARSSLGIDRGRKSELYAAANVGEYWIVDVDARAVERRSDPTPGGYRSSHVHRGGHPVPSPIVGVADLDPADLFRGF